MEQWIHVQNANENNEAWTSKQTNIVLNAKAEDIPALKWMKIRVFCLRLALVVENIKTRVRLLDKTSINKLKNWTN